MAEFIAVAGIAANLIQLVDFSAKVVRRLNDFQSSLDDVPKSLRSIKMELPILQHTVETLTAAINAGSIGAKTQKALAPALEGCLEQIEMLDRIFDTILPVAGDSWGRRSKKAILSLQQDSKVTAMQKVLRGYVTTLTFYCAATSSSLLPAQGV